MSGNQVHELLFSFDNGRSIRLELNNGHMVIVNRTLMTKTDLMRMIPKCISVSTLSVV